MAKQNAARDSRRRGRKAKRKTSAKDVPYHMRFDRQLYAAACKAARTNGRPLANWIRFVLAKELGIEAK